ncbi:hypothetical protein pb186bvf_018552 [Paramecium bursaria]
MENIEVITQGQSPEMRFQQLNQSQQLFFEETAPQIQDLSKINAKITPEIKAEQVLMYRDKNKNKIVCCKITTYKNTSQSDSKSCRICLSDEECSTFLNPCKCNGSLRYIHEHCLKVWILEKQGVDKLEQNQVKCEVCNQQFVMSMKFIKQLMPKMLQSASRAKKVCWVIEIIMALIFLGALAGIIAYIAIDNQNPLLFAAVTVLMILVVLTTLITYISCIEHMTVEFVEQWTISNYIDDPLALSQMLFLQQQRRKSRKLTIDETSSMSPRQRQRKSLQPGQIPPFRLIQANQ